MNLAICYTVFETELLHKSIFNHIDLVDKVIICYQEVSNTGQRKPFEFSFKYNPKLHFVKYNTDLSLNPKENERRKHQLMIHEARNLGCTHAILSATDHFYKADEFSIAKVRALVYDITFTGMYTYFKHPTWQLTPIEEYYMPFIFRLTTETKILKTIKYPLLVDPSVRVSHNSWYLFDDIKLHHYSLVRHDIRQKFINSASKFKPYQIKEFIDEYENYDISKNPGVKYFQGRKIKVVENYFKIL